MINMFTAPKDKLENYFGIKHKFTKYKMNSG